MQQPSTSVLRNRMNRMDLHLQQFVHGPQRWERDGRGTCGAREPLAGRPLCSWRDRRGGRVEGVCRKSIHEGLKRVLSKVWRQYGSLCRNLQASARPANTAPPPGAIECLRCSRGMTLHHDGRLGAVILPPRVARFNCLQEKVGLESINHDHSS